MRSRASAKRSSGVSFSRFLMMDVPSYSALVDAADAGELCGTGGDLLDGDRRRGAHAAIPDAEAGDVVQRGDAVAPGDLLALVVVAAGVRDRLLVDAAAQLRDLRRDLGLEPESV